MKPLTERIESLEHRAKDLEDEHKQLSHRLKLAETRDGVFKLLDTVGDVDRPAWEAKRVAVGKELHGVYKDLKTLHAEREKQVAAEHAAKKAELDAGHRETVVAIIKQAIALAPLVKREADLRHENRVLLGADVGSLPAMIPAGAAVGWFRLDDWQSGISFYIREAIKAGYISRDDKILKGIKLEG